MADDRLASYNAIATFLGEDAVTATLADFTREGVPESAVSFLSRVDEQAVARQETREEATDQPPGVGREVAKGGAAGGIIGGAAGFVAGAIAFGIPGIGPAVGTGIWATTVGSGVAGATAGGVIGGIQRMWDQRYRDAVSEGRLLVGVHSDDKGVVDHAAKIMEQHDPERVDYLDGRGVPLED